MPTERAAPLVLLLDGEGEVSWNFTTACHQLHEAEGFEAAMSFAYLFGRNERDEKGETKYVHVFEKTAEDMQLRLDWSGKKQHGGTQ